MSARAIGTIRTICDSSIDGYLSVLLVRVLESCHECYRRELLYTIIGILADRELSVRVAQGCNALRAVL